MENFNNSVMNLQTYGGNSLQAGYDQSYQGKLDYKLMEGKLDIEKRQVMQGQDYEFKQLLYDLKMEKQAIQRLLSSNVYQASDGKIFYSITGADSKNVICTKVLLNTERFEPVLYYSSYPALQAVLMISLGQEGNGKFYFVLGKDGISVNLFLKRLEARGINLLVSAREKKEAAGALLAYAIKNAKTTELMPVPGWGMDRNGNWHFAMPGELVMGEVLQYV